MALDSQFTRGREGGGRERERERERDGGREREGEKERERERERLLAGPISLTSQRAIL